MKKKIILLLVVLALAVFLTPRIYILSLTTWEYYHTNEICPESGRVTHFPLYEIKPYAVLTDRGYMYPGDAYDVGGEGSWYGMVTLLLAGQDGATFLVTYPVDDPVKGYSRPICKWFVPIGDYR
jgi:hypothetical protein